ncbi:MAG: DUF4956 domain-containing protein [Clostridiales Family XIII bacterium]|jgi:uncharacterized membrane protein YhiD involved in acid resistance|nr:DUF4956 domain-containing protein [Clostridiales Family XIII bacterium]
MTFSDIFKSKFLEGIDTASLPDMLISLALALALGLLIFFTYKKTFRGVMYSASFGVTLIVLTLITTVLILAVSSNVVLSLGMVGALSIVRFRAAIKDPLDLAFLFWSIAVGIVLAAGLIPLAVIGSVIIAVVLMVCVNRRPAQTPYILAVSVGSAEAERAAADFIKGAVKKSRVKSKTVTPGHAELNYDVRLRADDTDFVRELLNIPGVENAALVSYSGEYTG